MVGLGALPGRLLSEVGAGVAGVLAAEWKAGPPLDRPTYAFNEARSQFHAPAILRRLAALREGSGGAVLGLVPGDLFLPDDGDFVFGDVDRSAGAAVIGLGRLGADPGVVRRRAVAEGLHVLGVALELSSCLDSRCAMFAARDVPDVDRKGAGYCASCRAALGLP